MKITKKQIKQVDALRISLMRSNENLAAFLRSYTARSDIRDLSKENAAVIINYMQALLALREMDMSMQPEEKR